MGLFLCKEAYPSELKGLNLNGFVWLCFCLQPVGPWSAKSGIVTGTITSILLILNNIPALFVKSLHYPLVKLPTRHH